MRISIIAFIYRGTCLTQEQRIVAMQVLDDSSCIGDYLVRNIRQKDYFDCSRINFMCQPEKVSDKMMECLNTLNMDVPFDKNYFNWTDEEKQEYLYELAYNSFHTLCQRKNWDFEVVKSKLEELKALNFCYSFDTGLRCTQDKITVKLIGVHTMKKISFYVTSKKFGDKRILMHEAGPHVLDYGWSLGKLVWLNENTVALIDKTNKLENSIDLSNEINEIKARKK